MINIHKKFKMKNKAKKGFRYTIGKHIRFNLLDFESPKKEFKVNKTEYFLYEVDLYKRNDVDYEGDRYFIQLPVQKVWLKLYRLLEKDGMLQTKDILIEIKRHNNFNYDITFPITEYSIPNSI